MRSHATRFVALAALVAPMLAAPTLAAAAAAQAFSNPIPNVPGKTLSGVMVTYPPGAKSPPHAHGTAFVTAYVLSGAVRSQVDDGPVRVFKAGESFTENPGAQHRVSENASATEPASMLAVFVSDTGAATSAAPAAK